MAFSNKDLVDKLNKLNETQQSIEGLSMWMMFHRKRAKQCVEVWANEFKNLVQLDRRLVFLYLANHVIQSSRKKGAEFVQEFVRVLPEAFQGTARLARRANNAASSKVVQSIQRLVSIWHERKIFESSVIDELKLQLSADTDSAVPARPSVVTPVTSTERDRLADTWQHAEQLRRTAQSVESRVKVRAELLNGNAVSQLRSKEDVETAARELDGAIRASDELTASTDRAVDAQHKLLVLLREAVQRQEEHQRGLESQLNECKHRSEQLTRVKLKMQQMYATLPSSAVDSERPVKAIVMQSASDLPVSHVTNLEDELAINSGNGNKTDPFDIYFNSNPSDDSAPNPLPLYSYESYSGYEDMLAPGTNIGAPTEFSADPPYYP
jgi:hypothetical protein